MNLIPVTVISGFSGAGKTTLLRRIAGAREGQKVAVLTSAMDGGDRDAGLCESNTTDGTIRCESREHMGLELRKIGRAKTWDHVIVESTAASDPLPVADAFALDDGRGTPVSRYMKIDAMITLVDATTFLEDYASGDTLAARGLTVSPKDERRVVEALVAQVELADVILITKVDLADEARLPRVEAMLKKLNPRARVLRGNTAEVPLADLVGAALFDHEKSVAALHPARYFEGPDDTASHGFLRFGYRRRRPFHPLRFEALVHGSFAGVVRSKGIFWVASRPDSAGEWSQAGEVFHHATGGSFWAATPEAEWPVGENRKAEIKSLWEEPFGDRRQELAFVVEGIDRATLEERLDACLLTDEELALGPSGWRTLDGSPAPAGPAHAHSTHSQDHDAHDHDAHEHAAGEHTHEHVPFKGHSPAGGHHSN